MAAAQISARSKWLVALAMFFFGLACLPPVAALYGPASDVVVLSETNFRSKVVESEKIVLVEFFAPWCGHCRNLAPAWEKAATALKGIVSVAAVDADAHKSLGGQYGLKGFPTIKVFVPGRKAPLDYNGGRDAGAIVDYALEQVKGLVRERLGGKKTGGGGSSSGGGDSAVVKLTDSSFEEEVLKSSELWLVEFFAPWCGHCQKLAPEWAAAARKLASKKVKLGAVDCTVETGLAARYGVKGYPTILVFGADKTNPTPYEGPRSASGIEDYALTLVQEVAVAAEVVELTGQDSWDKACGSASICFVSFLPDILDTGALGRNTYIDILKAMAEKHKRWPYGYVWTEAVRQPQLEAAVGVGGYGYPAMVGLNAKKKAYSPLKNAFTEEGVKAFIMNPTASGVFPIESIPEVETREPWDGKDGAIIEEEEFSLEDLMKDEL